MVKSPEKRVGNEFRLIVVMYNISYYYVNAVVRLNM